MNKVTRIAAAGILTGIASLAALTGEAKAYTVVKGDTLSEIAKNHNMTLSEISSLNPNISNLDLIFIGEYIETGKSVKSNVAASQPEIKKEAKQEVVQEVKTVQGASHSLTNGEIELLARLVRAEAGGESFNGQVAVAEVVLNRMQSASFPNTLKGVIYQSGQFTPAMDGSINKAATSSSLEAVKVALSGTNYTNGAVFFYNSSTASNRWLDSRTTVAVIGNHTFKK